jgi:hypothetical protein
MNIDQVSEPVINVAILEHRSETEVVLVEIFGYDTDRAKLAVGNLWASYDHAPERERYLLLHNDPASLAGELAGQKWDRLYSRRLKEFNDRRRGRLQSYSKTESNALRPRKNSGPQKQTALGIALSERSRDLWRSQVAKQSRRVTEHQVSEAVLRILAANQNGRFTIARLKELLPEFLPLSAADRAPSLTRETEEVWEQQVRNIVSHRHLPGNIVFEGYATYEPRSLSITATGCAHVRLAD